MKTHIVLIMFAWVFFFAGCSLGAVIASDDFTVDGTGKILLYQMTTQSGIGFSNNWDWVAVVGGSRSIVQDRDADYAFVTEFYPTTQNMKRDFSSAVPATNGVLYVGLRGSAYSSSSTKKVNTRLSLRDQAGNNAFSVCINDDGAIADGGTLAYVSGGGKQTTTAVQSIADYDLVEVIAKIDFDNNTFTMWMNPTGIESGGIELTATDLDLSGLTSLSGMGLANTGITAGQNLWDSVAVGTRWQDVSSKKTLCYEFNTDGDFEGWTLENVYTNITNVTNGCMIGLSSSVDPQVRNDNVSFSADNVDVLTLWYKGDVSGPVQIFATTENFPNYIGHGNITASYTDPGNWQLLTFDLSGFGNWDGETVTKLRIDPMNLANKYFQIGFVALSNGDFDGDGVFDVDEGSDDPDADGVMNFRDPDNYNVMARLSDAHPRLIITTNTSAALQSLVTTGHSIAQSEYSALAARSQELMTNAVVTGFPVGPKPLYTCREVLALVQTLAVQRMITGDTNYSARIWQEIDSVTGTNFPDWYPEAFLAVAEMTMAVATAYDWLYDDWTPAQRTQMAEAILEKGLKAGFTYYDETHVETDADWWDVDNNWNPVCYGGLGCGALAIADVYPDEAVRWLSLAIRNIQPAMEILGPDGASNEGPTYWEYGTLYNTYFIAALDTALGTDFDLSEIDGYEKSGFFQYYMSDPSMMSYDIEDAGLRFMSSPQHFWFSHRYSEPAHSRFRINGIEKYLNEDPDSLVFLQYMPMDLIWFDDSGTNETYESIPVDNYYQKSEIGSSRSAWDNPDALSLLFQGGDNTESHAHHDLGSFILNYGGDRMVMDCGVEPLSYSTSQARWSYYRTTAFGHNGMMFRAAGSTSSFDQDWAGTAAITNFSVPVSGGLDATIDLSNAYGTRVDEVTRRFELNADRTVVTVTDYVDATSAMEAYWQIHTKATVEIEEGGQVAVLRLQNGQKVTKQMRVTIKDAPDGSSFMLFDTPASFPSDPGVIPNPQQTANAGVSRLAIHLDSIQTFTLQVEFSPQDSDGDGQPDVQEQENGRDPFDVSDLAFYFDTDGKFEGWINARNITNLSVTNGVLCGQSETDSPYVWNKYMNFNSEEISTVYARFCSATNGPVDFYWMNTVQPGAYKHVTGSYTNAGSWQVIEFDVQSDPAWLDSITIFRVDPVDVVGFDFEIDWIVGSDGDRDDDSIADTVEGFEDTDGDGILDFCDADSDDDGIPDAEEGSDDVDGDGLENFRDLDSDGDGQTDSIEAFYGQDPYSASDFSYLFDIDGEKEGWIYAVNISGLTVTNGVLAGQALSDANYLFNNSLNMAATNIQTVYVRLAADSTGVVRFYWKNPDYCSDYVARMYTNAHSFSVLQFNVQSSSDWTGIVSRIRLDSPCSSNGVFSIDWILGSDGDLDDDGIPDANESLTEDSDNDGLEDFRDPEDGDQEAGIWNPAEPVQIVLKNISGSGPRVSFEGQPGYTYHLERTLFLLNPVWISVESIGPVLTDQACTFVEFMNTNPAAFYRVREKS